MAVNVRGMYLMAMGCARAMAASGHGGAVVCTGSTASFMGEELQLSYNVSKAAVMGLVRSLGIALAPYGIRVNGLAPGYVRTRATASGLDVAASWSGPRSRIPADRPAEPEEIAAVATFLFSRDASYMTGELVVQENVEPRPIRTL